MEKEQVKENTKKKAKPGIIILVIVLIVLVVLALFVWNSMNGSNAGNSQQAFLTTGDSSKANEGLQVEDIAYNPSADMNIVEIDGQKYRQKENMVNVLLMGIDSDGSRVKQSMGWRSDMLMLVSVDLDTNEITCTSIPRDSRANVYHVDSKGKITSQVTEKLNHAYAYGGGPTKYSAENTMRCTSEVLACSGQINVPINYYISIDLEGLPKLANELGGVPVTLDQNVPGVGSKGETVTLQSDTTRKFLENRHDMDEGEMTRQSHEQMFIKSMANMIQDMGAVKAAPSLYKTFLVYMRSNLKLDEVMTLAKTLDAIQIDNMKFNSMEAAAPEIIDGVWYYRLSEDEMLPMMLDILYEKI